MVDCEQQRIDRYKNMINRLTKSPFELSLLAVAMTVFLSACDSTPPPDMSFDQLAKAVEKADNLDDIISSFPPNRVKTLDNKVAFLVATDPGYEDEPMQILTASREDGSWVVGYRVSLMNFDSTSVGTVNVTGTETYNLEHGFVALNRHGYYIGDVLTESLLDGARAPKVLITLSRDQQKKCFTVGTIPIGQIIVEGKYGGKSLSGFAMSGKFIDMGDKNWAAFSEALSGTLHVESIEGARFSGRYTFTASNHSGESAEVSGTIDHAQMPCAN
jgi:hypothetical protein